MKFLYLYRIILLAVIINSLIAPSISSQNNGQLHGLVCGTDTEIHEFQGFYYDESFTALSQCDVNNGHLIPSQDTLRIMVLFIRHNDEEGLNNSYWPSNGFPNNWNSVIDSTTAQNSSHYFNLTNFYREASQNSNNPHLVIGHVDTVTTSLSVNHGLTYQAANAQVMQQIEGRYSEGFLNQFDQWRRVGPSCFNKESNNNIDFVIMIWRVNRFGGFNTWDGIANIGNFTLGSKTANSGVTVALRETMFAQGFMNESGLMSLITHEIAHKHISGSHPQSLFTSAAQQRFPSLLSFTNSKIITHNGREADLLGWGNHVHIDNTSSLESIITLSDFYESGESAIVNINNRKYLIENRQNKSIYDNATINDQDKGLFIYQHNSNSGNAINYNNNNNNIIPIPSDGFYNWIHHQYLYGAVSVYKRGNPEPISGTGFTMRQPYNLDHHYISFIHENGNTTDKNFMGNDLFAAFNTERPYLSALTNPSISDFELMVLDVDDVTGDVTLRIRFDSNPYTIDENKIWGGNIYTTDDVVVNAGNTLRIISGTHFISKGNLTIQAGAELIIEPGVTIKLDPGKSIVANGALTAIGTQNDPIRVERNGSSAWNRISVNGNSDIRWAVIDGGQTGLEVSGSDNQIRNSIVENNWYGIWMNNVSATTLSKTLIRDNLYEGLLLYGSNDINNSIHENTITNNGNAGFYLLNSELANFHKNVIENTSGNGISIMGSSHLFFQENIGAPNDAGLNRVKNNSGHQIYISHSSRAFLGNSYFSGTDAGHNSVYHSNSSYSNKYIYNLAVTGPGYSGTSFSILAQFTYWNTYPSSGMFHGAVNVYNHLSSDPTSGSGAPASQTPLLMSPDYTEISLPAILTSSISEHIASQYENLTEADNAISIKTRMIELRGRLAQNPYAKENSIYLNELYTLSLLDRGNRLEERSNVEKTLGDWTGKRFYLQRDFRGDNNVSLAVETAMLIHIREALKAEDIALAVEYIADFSPYIRNKDHQMALAKNMIAVDIKRGGYQAGLDTLSELFRIEPDRDVEKWFSAPDLSSIEFLLNDLMNSNGKGEPSLYRFASEMDMASNEQQPVSFALGHNYPNPFNPSTVIPFSIPVQSNVSIEIYDILGRLITRLSNETYETGLHEVSWDASQMASGVYLVRAVIDPLDNQGRQQNFTRAITLLK